MRFVDRLPVWLLLLVAVVLAAANLWVTAARSTIPLELRSQVVDLEIRHEKHPGADDVFFLVLEGGRKLHVDKPVFEALTAGDAIEKPRFDHRLQIRHADGSQDRLQLTPSVDSQGMHTVMPLVLGVAIALALVARSRESS